MNRVRSLHEGVTTLIPLQRSAAIKQFCYECMGFNHGDVTGCTSPLCPLFPFRKGTVDPDYSPITADEAQAYL